MSFFFELLISIFSAAPTTTGAPHEPIIIILD